MGEHVQRIAFALAVALVALPLASAQEPGTVVVRPAPDLAVFGPQNVTVESGGRASFSYTLHNRLDMEETFRLEVLLNASDTTAFAARVVPALVVVPPNGSAVVTLELLGWEVENDTHSPMRLHVRLAEGPPFAPPVQRFELNVTVTAPPESTLPAPAVLLALGVAAAAGAMVAAFRRVEWLRYAILGALPLYTRLAPAKLLQQERREALHRLIEEEPGINFSTLMRRSGLPNGALIHHLRQLERHRLIVSRRDGPLRRFATVATAFPPAAPRPLTPMQERVLSMLEERPLTQRQIAEALGLSQQGANRHVKALERRGLLAIEYADGEWRCHARHNASSPIVR